MVDKKQDTENNNNVIEFPREKATPSKVVELPVEKREPQVDHSKYWYSGVIVAILALTVSINSTDSFDEMTNSSQSRSLASVGQTMTTARDSSFEKKVAEQLSQKSSRKPASFGREPSKIDEFKFGFLESKYAVKFYQGKVQEVEFTQSESLEPRYLTDRKQFLHQNKDLFAVPFQSTVSLNREVAGEKVHETYALLNNSKTKVGQVHFELDIYGRLLALKVKSAE